jgi:hypothetical protein
MDKQELKKVRKIYKDINSIAKIGRDNSLEYYKYIDDIVRKSDLSYFNTCLFLSYGIDYTKYQTIFELKSLTWDIICFQTLTPLDEKLKILYGKNNVYQIGKDVFSESRGYFNINISLPLSYTYSVTDYTSQFTIYEKNNQLQIKIVDYNLYNIKIYKDYLFQSLLSGTYSSLYELPIDNDIKISSDTFKTNIPLESGKYEIVTYKRDTYDLFKYELNIQIKNKIGKINEIDSFDYISKSKNSYYDTYEKSHFNKNEYVDYLMGTKRTFLNVVRYKTDGNIDEEFDITYINPNYSENTNLYNRYLNAINFIKKSNTVNTLNDDIYSVWNSESIMYSLYQSLHSIWSAGDLLNPEYGNIEVVKIGEIKLVEINNNKNAYKFNSGYFTLPNDSLMFKEDFSINIRIFLDNANGNQKIISCYNKYEGDVYGWYLELNNGQVSFVYRMSDWKLYTSNFEIPKNLFGKWITITVIFSDRNDLRFLINGNLEKIYTLPKNTKDDLKILYTSLNKCSIGIGTFLKQAESPISPNNLIDSIGVWSKSLSQDEVTSLYNNGKGMEYPFKNLIESANDWLNFNNATMSNVSINRDGKVGKCFLFGDNSYLSFPINSLNINNFNEFTLSMWVNFKEVGMTQSIFECKNGNDGYDLLVNNLNNIQLNYNFNSYEQILIGPKLDKDSWNLICLTLLKDINNKSTFNLFVNSNNHIKDNIIEYTESLYNMKPIIGKLLSSGSKIDSITTWSKVLSKDEIVSLYNNANGREYPFTLSDTNTPYDSTTVGDDIVPTGNTSFWNVNANGREYPFTLSDTNVPYDSTTVGDDIVPTDNTSFWNDNTPLFNENPDIIESIIPDSSIDSSIDNNLFE